MGEDMENKQETARGAEALRSREKAPRTKVWLKKHPKIRKALRGWELYLMLLPVVVFYLVFNYVPMYGILLAFKDYLPKYGILGSEWVGLKHFQEFFANPSMTRAIKNTLVISSLKIVFCFPVPVIFALLLNEFQHTGYKKWIQTTIYLPNFISWVIIGGLVRQLFATSGGLVNNLIEAFGGKSVAFLTTPSAFYPLLICLEIWKGSGWGTIIYIAGVSNIDPTLYEAAIIDGAGRFRRMWSITLPCILPIIVVSFINTIGGIMNAGFDPIFNLYNKTIYEVADIIDTLVYRLGITEGNYEMSTAIGLFKNVINFCLVIFTNIATKKITGYSMYSFD